MTNGTDSLDMNALEQLLAGESTKMAHIHASSINSKYGPIKPQMLALQEAVSKAAPELVHLLDKLREQFDPEWEVFSLSRGNLTDLSFFKFMQVIGHTLLVRVENSAKRTSQLGLYGAQFLPVFDKKASVGDLMLAEEAAESLLNTAHEEYQDAVTGFEKLLAGVYMATRNEYRKLRRKYLGEGAKEDRDPIEDNLMMQLFGSRMPQQEPPMGPATALVGDNCILTQVLTDLADSLPKNYEKTIPIMKKGIPTGKTKTIKQLDDGEIEEFALLMIAAAHPTFLQYIETPSKLLEVIMKALTRFYASYQPVATALKTLVEKTSPATAWREHDKKMLDPRAIGRQYARINFLSIRPTADDVAPRTKVEHDFAAARLKLFTHLHETFLELSRMDRGPDSADQVEKYTVARTKEAIELKEEMDEVLKSERQRTLARNIKDDNEFYIGKSGNLGSLEVEREPAPRITYDDVVGESFVKAKLHVEEVVKIASHPNVMRISAPRGDIKSNLLMIGPYGCGKTELAKAVGSDRRIIGFNVSTSDLLTAYMHESVKNIKRLYDHAKDLRRKSRYTKPVGILLDEIDRFFSYGEGTHQAYDGPRMEGVLQEMMDGVVGYEGVFMVGLTNVPKAIPEAILRRFKYVDVVGQLNQEERAKLFRQFLTKGLPIADTITHEHYMGWADKLVHAPGDVIGKVVDEVHFKFMKEYVDAFPKKIAAVERNLAKKLRDREIQDSDRKYFKKVISAQRIVQAQEIDEALEAVLRQPQVQMQITKAKDTYRDAEEIMKGLSKVGESGLGFAAGRRDRLWGR